MFVLTTIADLIQISPEDLDKPGEQKLEQVIEDNINAKYANKVISKIGLCICLYDVLKCSDGLIGHGTGIVNVNVDFRLVVFRPFKGEILQGVILDSSNSKEIHIGLDFFEDIVVPGPFNLFEGSKYDVAESTWVWKTEDGSELFFDKSETVRFRVESEVWPEEPPKPKKVSVDAVQEVEPPTSPYRIIASMAQGGLGPIVWWEEGEEVEEMEA